MSFIDDVRTELTEPVPVEHTEWPKKRTYSIDEIASFVSDEAIKKASAAMAEFASNVDRASKALRDMEGQDHGGIVIQVVGDLVHIEIKPKA